MKKNIDQPNNKPKLSLHKQTIAKLSVHDMLLLQGGGTKEPPHPKSQNNLAGDPCTSGTTIGCNNLTK